MNDEEDEDEDEDEEEEDDEDEDEDEEEEEEEDSLPSWLLLCVCLGYAGGTSWPRHASLGVGIFKI